MHINELPDDLLSSVLQVAGLPINVLPGSPVVCKQWARLAKRSSSQETLALQILLEAQECVNSSAPDNSHGRRIGRVVRYNFQLPFRLDHAGTEYEWRVSELATTCGWTLTNEHNVERDGNGHSPNPNYIDYEVIKASIVGGASFSLGEYDEEWPDASGEAVGYRFVWNLRVQQRVVLWLASLSLEQAILLREPSGDKDVLDTVSLVLSPTVHNLLRIKLKLQFMSRLPLRASYLIIIVAILIGVSCWSNE